MSKDNTRTVWSSDGGDQRKKSLTNLTPDPHGLPRGRGEFPPPQQQTAYLHRDSKGRGGKSVTLIKSLVLSEEDMKALAKRIKQDCGVGGTVKDGVIEIQSGQRERIAGDPAEDWGTRSRSQGDRTAGRVRRRDRFQCKVWSVETAVHGRDLLRSG
jgi:predicted translation initiation factor SUI1